MRSLWVLLAFLTLGGCVAVSDLGEGARYQMSEAGLLDHSNTRRSNSLRIQPDSFIYIAQGPFAPIGDPSVRPNIVAEEAFNGFVEYFPMVRRARQAGIKRLFVLTTRTEHWFVERGFKLGTVDELPAAKKEMYNWQRRSKVLWRNV